MKKNIITFCFMGLTFAILLGVLFLPGCTQSQAIRLDYDKALQSLVTSEADNISAQFSLQYIDVSGNLQKTDFSATDTNCHIYVFKNCIVPVLISPSDSAQTDMASTGFLYPFCSEFSVAGGFCAFVYIKLFQNSFNSARQVQNYCRYFNWNRLYTKIQDYENPFLLNADLICHDIANATFSTYSIKLKD